jgi:hypothetical protein
MTERFSAQQTVLERKIHSGEARFVYLDPVETWPDWLAVVIEHPTGVVFGQQCAGTSTDQRLVEGYLVPLGGSRFDVDNGQLSSAPLRAVFHDGDGCTHGWGIKPLDGSRLQGLVLYIEDIPYWRHTNVYDCSRQPLRLDYDRQEEICEAWVPVLTPDGKGILLWPNCD